jgi:hypothetical protein
MFRRLRQLPATLIDRLAEDRRFGIPFSEGYPPPAVAQMPNTSPANHPGKLLGHAL